MKSPKVGAKILVNSHHWLRANQQGEIIAILEDPNRVNKFLIEFKDKAAGRGIDGDKLYLAEDQFEVVQANEPH